MSSSFEACIHRGVHQIGGSCVELSYDGARILLDLGKPLDAEDMDPSLLPSVSGLKDGSDTSLKGVVISHGHVDHWGLMPLVHSDIPGMPNVGTTRH